MSRTDGTGVIAMVTGMATANAASSVMALGTDPRFDLSKAYWIVAGIRRDQSEAEAVSAGAYGRIVSVDGDVAYEIDGREIPGSWSTGVIPWERTEPYEEPRPTDMQQLYRLNPGFGRLGGPGHEGCRSGGHSGNEKNARRLHRIYQSPGASEGNEGSDSFHQPLLGRSDDEQMGRGLGPILEVGERAGTYTTTCEDSGINASSHQIWRTPRNRS